MAVFHYLRDGYRESFTEVHCKKDERKHSQVARRENLNRGNKLFSMKVF